METLNKEFWEKRDAAMKSAERYCNEELFNRSHLQNLADRFGPELQLASSKL